MRMEKRVKRMEQKVVGRVKSGRNKNESGVVVACLFGVCAVEELREGVTGRFCV
jgi:hypothetical protein